MAKYTEHYQLHQWEPEDPFLRTDFNEDLNKVDQALSQLASEKYGEDKKAYVCGSYIGDGGTGMQDIALSFQPTLLFVEHDRIFREKIATQTVEFMTTE